MYSVKLVMPSLICRRIHGRVCGRHEAGHVLRFEVMVASGTITCTAFNDATALIGSSVKVLFQNNLCVPCHVHFLTSR